MARRNILVVTVLAVGLATGSWAMLREPARSAQSGSAAPVAVPATVGKVTRQDVAVYVDGLGTVQAWRSVTARAQVSGYLSRIAFREGQTVKTGDLLATIDPRPYAAALAQAQARQQSDAANLANDRLNYARDSNLARDQFASRQQADNDLAMVHEYQAGVQGDAAAIAAAQLNLDFCRITAPIDGVVGYRLVDVGNLIEASAQTPIVTIEQIHPIAIVFTLPEQQFERVQSARAGATLAVLAFTADGQTQLGRGTLVTPDNTIDTTTGTISLKAIFANTDDRLWPGQYVEAHLQLGTEHNAVTVPMAAVEHGPEGLYVFVVGRGNVVSERPIEVGYQDDRFATVTKGLSGGEAVVIAGQSRLQSGATIQPTSPPAKS